MRQHLNLTPWVAPLLELSTLFAVAVTTQSVRAATPGLDSPLIVTAANAVINQCDSAMLETADVRRVS